ncbi:MAG: transposase, partial [Actinomycetia bacterium]|nr:transposase [Actinomycetes bacterium]
MLSCGLSWRRRFLIDAGRRRRPWNDHRVTLEGICWRLRTGSRWRDPPEVLGAWQSVWERLSCRWAADGT